MLELDENGKIINITNKSVDELKRAPYGHSNQEILEENEEIESFVDNLEEIEDGADAPPEADLDPDVVEIAMAYAEFKVNFVKQYGEEELQEAFGLFEDFFSSKGINVSLDLTEEEEIPGMESSEQSIVTSEVEEV